MPRNFPAVMAMGEVTAYLKVSRQYVNALCKGPNPKLRYQKTSAGKIFLKEDVIAFRKQRAQRARIDPRIRL